MKPKKKRRHDVVTQITVSHAPRGGFAAVIRPAADPGEHLIALAAILGMVDAQLQQTFALVEAEPDVLDAIAAVSDASERLLRALRHRGIHVGRERRRTPRFEEEGEPRAN